MSLRIRRTMHRRRPSEFLVTIGVCGLSRGAGATCFCIALSNYLCSRKKKKTAYAEMNAAGEIRYLNQSQTISDASQDAFSLLDICIYPEAFPGTIAEVQASGYDYLVLDFGMYSTRNCAEFLRCNLRLIICDFSPWKQNTLQHQLKLLTDQIEIQETVVTFLVNSGKYTRPELFLKKQKCLQHHTYQIQELPFLPNPFLITPSTFEVFEKIITGV